MSLRNGVKIVKVVKVVKIDKIVKVLNIVNSEKEKTERLLGRNASHRKSGLLGVPEILIITFRCQGVKVIKRCVKLTLFLLLEKLMAICEPRQVVHVRELRLYRALLQR